MKVKTKQKLKYVGAVIACAITLWLMAGCHGSAYRLRQTHLEIKSLHGDMRKKFKRACTKVVYQCNHEKRGKGCIMYEQCASMRKSFNQSIMVMDGLLQKMLLIGRSVDKVLKSEQNKIKGPIWTTP